MGDQGAASPEELPREATDPARGHVALRVIATKPSTGGVFRLDQLVAAVAREALWLTDAYFVGASPYIQALIAARGTASTCGCSCPGTVDCPASAP